MKVKIKGLVFVGFAAAILSANAMADDTNTVTSKAYTEAMYQHKSDRVVDWANKTTEEKTAALASDALYPSMKTLDAEMDALTTAITNTNNAAQVKSTANYQLGGTGGSWKQVEAGTYVAAPVQGTTANDAKIDIKDNMIVGTKETVTSGTNQLTTAAGVKAYAQKISDTANQISDGNGGWKALDQAINNDTAASPNAPTTAAVKTYVDNALTDGNHATYQPYEATANKISGADGSWKALNSDVTDAAVTAAGADFDGDNAASTTAIRTYVQGKIVDSVAGTSTTEAPSQGSVKTALDTKENLSNKAAAIVTDSNAPGYNADSADKYASTKAVYDYVNSATGIAAMPAACATTPCALVTDNGTPTWVVIAQPANP